MAVQDLTKAVVADVYHLGHRTPLGALNQGFDVGQETARISGPHVT